MQGVNFLPRGVIIVLKLVVVETKVLTSTQESTQVDTQDNTQEVSWVLCVCWVIKRERVLENILIL